MEQNQPGLTPQERESLSAQPEEDEKKMDLKMSLLAFASLLLVCALIVVASIIARSHANVNSPDIGTVPVHESPEAASQAEGGQQSQTGETQPQPDPSF